MEKLFTKEMELRMKEEAEKRKATLSIKAEVEKETLEFIKQKKEEGIHYILPEDLPYGYKKYNEYGSYENKISTNVVATVTKKFINSFCGYPFDIHGNRTVLMIL